MARYRIVEHSVRCQYIRERAGAAEPGYENRLRIAVKQYIPISNPNPAAGDVTIIATHANAFPKVQPSALMVVLA